ncbi:MAG: hypothetical protein H5T65_04065 [Chloroflexi bacterium]|nr:hypothetical protein [Chloroflexota bacterium]
MAEMAETAQKFLEDSRKTLDKITAKLVNIRGALGQGSALDKMVTGLEASRDDLVKRLDEIAPDQPLETAAKRKIQGDLATLKRRVSRVNDGIQFAVDPQPPKAGAWVWFLAELVLIVLVAYLYVDVHQGRPLRAFLRGVSPAARVELAIQTAELKALATAQPTDLEALVKGVSALEAAFARAGFAPDDAKIFADAVERMRAELARKDKANGEVVGVYLDRIVEDVLKGEEGFFWDRGVGRYVEVLFAIFFGVMAFALYNTWEYMRHPGRSWWVAWHVAKAFMALVLGFVTIVILSQVNFATPASLEKQTALGLGTAPIELVMAVSALAGYFSHRMLGFLDRYADKVFGPPA